MDIEAVGDMDIEVEAPCKIQKCHYGCRFVTHYPDYDCDHHSKAYKKLDKVAKAACDKYRKAGHSVGRRLLSTEPNNELDNAMAADLELETGAKLFNFRRRRLTSFKRVDKYCDVKSAAWKACLKHNHDCNAKIAQLEKAVKVAQNHEKFWANKKLHWAAQAKKSGAHSAAAKREHDAAVREAKAAKAAKAKAAKAEKIELANLRAAEAASKSAAKTAAAKAKAAATAGTTLKARTAAHDKAKLAHLNAVAHKNKSDKAAAAAAAAQKKAVATHKTAADKAAAAALAAAAAAPDHEETGASVKNAEAALEKATKELAAATSAQAKADREVQRLAGFYDKAKVNHLKAAAAAYKKAADAHQTNAATHAHAVLQHKHYQNEVAKATRALAGR